eukprot:6186157-Pleurochrysis_carterae.AAC.4
MDVLCMMHAQQQAARRGGRDRAGRQRDPHPQRIARPREARGAAAWPSALRVPTWSGRVDTSAEDRKRVELDCWFEGFHRI